MDKDVNIKKIANKYIKGNSSPKELETAFKLFDDPYHNLSLRPVLFELWNKYENEETKKIKKKGSLQILNNIHRYIHLIQERKTHRGNISKLMRNSLKVAAILIIGILSGVLIRYNLNTEQIYYTAIAPKGSISQMILPDNTVVFLNSDSRLKYSLNKKNNQREVFLKGEAWFEVEKNEKIPFVVHTPFYDIKVLGTQFNVKAYETDEEIVTTLEEGTIEVLSAENSGINKNKLLKPGQQFVYNHTTKTSGTETVRTRLYTSWKENKLIFLNMNLKELIVVLERKYGVDIEVSDDIILNYHYDGTIMNETIIEVLELLKETLPVEYQVEGQKIIIQKENNKTAYE